MAVTYNTKDAHIAVTAFFNAKARYGPVIATTLISNARLGQSSGNKFLVYLLEFYRIQQDLWTFFLLPLCTLCGQDLRPSDSAFIFTTLSAYTQKKIN